MVHHADPVGEHERFLLVVGDQDRRHAQPALHLADGLAQFDADLGIERAERLIEQQHLGLVCERAGHRDALLLAAGELPGKAGRKTFQRHQLQQLVAATGPVAALHAADPQREFDVLADRHVPEQRIVLEHEADAAIACAHVRDVPAAKADAPVVEIGKSRRDPQQGALAAAAGAQQHEEFPGFDLQRYVVDDRTGGVAFGDLLEMDGHASSRSVHPRKDPAHASVPSW